MSGRVLVLNQSYEPVSVCNIRKAVVLVFLDKAEIVATANGRTIHTVKEQYPFPSVIRLAHYKRIPHRSVILSRKNIIRRDGHRCQYCGATAPPITVDHVIPRSQGGGETWENLVAACVRCNNTKGDRTPEKAGMHLHSVPRRPSHVSFIIHSVGSVEGSWRQFLFMA